MFCLSVVDVGNYNPGNWPGGAFNLFDIGMTRAAVTASDFTQFLTAAQQAELAACPWFAGNVQHNGRFQTNLRVFLEERVSQETTEATDHSRNDALLRILIEASGLALVLSRDSDTSPTSDRSRPDCNLALLNFPPYLLVEEKAASADIAQARQDLITKFNWILHYHRLPFVFAIAIAGNVIEFGILTPNGNYNQLPGPAGAGQATFSTNQPGTVADALRCVQAAINIGRYVRFIHQNTPAEGLGLAAMNTTIHRGANKRLRITFLHVTKHYNAVSVAEKDRMKQFYHDTRAAPRLEKGTVHDNSRGQVTFRLTPVGVRSFPAAADGNGIRRFLRDMLSALHGVHTAGWLIVDLRPPNIILTIDSAVAAPQTRYVIIDACEFAQRIAVAAPVPAGHVAPTGWPGGPLTTQWDLLMLAQPFRANGCPATINALPNGAAFLVLLLAGATPAVTLLAHAFLAGITV
jgi:hypothetical protein